MLSSMTDVLWAQEAERVLSSFDHVPDCSGASSLPTSTWPNGLAGTLAQSEPASARHPRNATATCPRSP